MAEDFRGIEDILARCVENMKSAQGDIESCLAPFPEWAEELRPLLALAIWLDERKGFFDPHPDFVAASRSRLVARIKRGDPETLEQ